MSFLTVTLRKFISFRTFLSTLDQRNLSNGAAEMLKMACVKDAELFYLLENHGGAFVDDKFQVRTASFGKIPLES